MKIFIAIKHYKGDENRGLVDNLKEIVRQSGHTPYCFLDEKHIENSKKMMKQAFEKITECDALLVEGSGCSFGAGAEAGYAKAQNKKIIVVVKQGIEVSNTLEGVSDYYIAYKDMAHLKQGLQKGLTNFS